MTSLIPPCYSRSLLLLYLGLFLLYLYSKLIIEDLGLFVFCFALALFFFLEDPVRKLHENCGTRLSLCWVLAVMHIL